MCLFLAAHKAAPCPPISRPDAWQLRRSRMPGASQMVGGLAPLHPRRSAGRMQRWRVTAWQVPGAQQSSRAGDKEHASGRGQGRRLALDSQNGFAISQTWGRRVVDARTTGYQSASRRISIVLKGTEERNRALTDLGIARRAVSFPCTTTGPFPTRTGNNRGERPPKLSEPISRPTLL
jgi:hypothetical protein